MSEIVSEAVTERIFNFLPADAGYSGVQKRRGLFYFLRLAPCFLPYDVVGHLQHFVSRFNDFGIRFISSLTQDHIDHFINHVDV